ncbi:MAG: glycosyltransferase [Clostridia bacterium]|nr:glycosyltransferase [Clostridia bacterium]
MKLLQINVTANWGSTGKIAEDIGKLAIEAGWESWIAYGRGNPSSASNLIRIGSDWDMKLHGLQTRIFDNHGLASKKATKEFIQKVKEIQPDIIHLHNIHGYYINYYLLFEFLKEYGRPVVWTLHDCWTFTGHCSHFVFARCDKWKSGCFDCPEKGSYPKSLIIDRSRQNYIDKKNAFLGLRNLTIVPVSNWLSEMVSKSFFKGYPINTIHNGIDLSVFNSQGSNSQTEKGYYRILGVASVWNDRKGLADFIHLRSLLPKNYEIVLVGLTQDQIDSLPSGIRGITRTENIQQMVDLYASADVFVNPTLEDTFPTTNIEALACGTPVVTYRTGGSPEAIDVNTGVVVPYGSVMDLAEAVKKVCENREHYRPFCRERAEKYFDCNKQYKKYIELYESVSSVR